MKNSILQRKFRYVNYHASTALVLINAVVFVITYLFFPRLTYYLAMFPRAIIINHAYWQFVTYMFVHGSFQHILFNMFGLYMFGHYVEDRLGSREFLLFYFLTGTLSGVASFFGYYLTGTNALLMGASGAIYAVMLLFAVLFPQAVVYVFGIIPLRAPILICVYFCIEFFSQFAFDGVAHTTHLFGLVFAWLYCVIRLRINPLKVW